MKLENLNQKRIYLLFNFIPVKLPSNPGGVKGQKFFFTNLNQNVNDNNITYLHDPTISCSEIVYDGGFSEPNITITLAKNNFTNLFTSNEVRANYRISIVEITENPITLERKKYTIFRGYVIEGKESVQGKNVVNLTCANDKILLSEVSLGFPISPTCPLAFGNENGSLCKVTLEDKRYSAVVSFIKDTEVILSSITLPPANTVIEKTNANQILYSNNFFVQGYFEYEEARVTITKWDRANPNQFFLLKKIPDSWIAKQIIVVPGCTKTQKRCSEWNNLNRFGGLLKEQV